MTLIRIFLQKSSERRYPSESFTWLVDLLLGIQKIVLRRLSVIISYFFKIYLIIPVLSRKDATGKTNYRSVIGLPGISCP